MKHPLHYISFGLYVVLTLAFMLFNLHHLILPMLAIGLTIDAIAYFDDKKQCSHIRAYQSHIIRKARARKEKDITPQSYAETKASLKGLTTNEKIQRLTDALKNH